MNPLSMGLLGMLGDGQQQQSPMMSALGLQPFGFLKNLQGIMGGHTSPYSGLGMLQGGMGGIMGGQQPQGKSPYDNMNPMQLDLLRQLFASMQPRV